ncbi:MAG: hypothetical protein ABR616_01110 [Dermatophilaceae bacterium]
MVSAEVPGSPGRSGIAFMLLGHRAVVTWREPPALPGPDAIPAATAGAAAVRAALTAAAPLLVQIDHVLGAETGELSRVARGELDIPQCDPMAVAILEFCSNAYHQTDGGFDAFVEGATGRRHLDPGFPGLALAADRVASRLHQDTGLALVLRCDSVAAVRTTPADPAPFAVHLLGTAGGTDAETVVPLTDGGAVACGMRVGVPGGLVAVASPSLPWAAVYAAVLAREGRAGMRRLRSVPGLQAAIRTPSGAAVTLRDGQIATATPSAQYAHR